MLRTKLLRAVGTRSISNNPRIIRSNVMRKIKKGADRLPSQGPDPAAQFKNGWRLASAAVLERYPVVTPDVDPFEQEYVEGRFLEQQKHARPMPARFFLTEKDVAEGKTEPSFEDPQADQYVPAPRVTEADRTNDIKSLERALPERLYFVVSRSDKTDKMTFPQVLVKDDDVKMAHLAENAFKSVTMAASRPKVHFMSFSPACHLEHVYPPKYQEKQDVYGIKIFFYRAMLMSGEIEGVRNAIDYAWARDCELPKLLGDEYYSAIKPILFGNGPTINKE